MLFGITSLLGAFLLFQVQPLIAKYILPWYGGTPAVWTTCMLFFQVALLAGYAYAHKFLHPLAPRRQVMLHGALLAAAVGCLAAQAALWHTPLLPHESMRGDSDAHPVSNILLVLTLSVGLCSVVLATTSPVVQSWHARTWPDRSPYKLYALSNIGSLAALLTYPFVFEPTFSLRVQAHLWAVLFVIYVALCVLCGARMIQVTKGTERTERTEAAPAPGAGRRVLWFLLSACGCLALLAVTSLVCQEIAVVPFLWIAPLSLYLLSFIVCFEYERLASRRFWVFALAVASLAATFVLYFGTIVPLIPQVLVFDAALFALCMVCNGELVRSKPAPAHLTDFYLAIAAGGCAGGLFASVIAPIIFQGLWEFHVALLGCWALVMAVLVLDPTSCVYRGDRLVPLFLVPGAMLFLGYVTSPQASAALQQAFGARGLSAYYALWAAAGASVTWLVYRRPATSSWHAARTRWPLFGFLFLFNVSLLILMIQRAEFYDHVRAVSRNFYGILRVTEDEADDPAWRHFTLRHGAILHGLEFTAADKRMLPSSYYTEGTGIGLAFQYHPRRVAGESLRVGCIGLGVGAIAAYARTNDFVRFYEINPAVTRIARDTNFFAYLTSSPAQIEVRQGDARLALEKDLRDGNPGTYDILVLDAFTSDAIPAHLLTKEAFDLYLKHLRGPDGWLALHISNRHIDLRPVVRAAADAFDLDTLCVEHDATDERMRNSTWIVLARRGHIAIPPKGENRWFNENVKHIRMWTDDFSNLFDVLR